MRRNNDVDENDEPAARFINTLRYISVNAIITTSTSATATIYRSSIVQNEVLTSGVLLMNSSTSGTQYPIRFVNNRTYTPALQLRPGDKICIEQGRFVSKPGRKETEFHVKSFTTLN